MHRMFFSTVKVLLFEKLILYKLHVLRAYDRAAIKFRGVHADINFSPSDYEEDLKQVALKFTSL